MGTSKSGRSVSTAGRTKRPPRRTARRVLCGLEILARDRPAWLRNRRIGLLTHPAAVTATLVPARDVLHRLCGEGLRCLFGPQHGFAGDKQDNMIESADSVDAELRIPVHSLYAETRTPTPAMLAGIDALLIDLQDVGSRVYTFVWTATLVLEACAAAGVEVVILDRPNPIGGTEVEGNLVRSGYESFVGLHSVPMRHGLTIGELAALVNLRLELRNEEGGSGRVPDRARRRFRGLCRLTVVPMEGWRRAMRFPDTGRPWVLPSPNMPTFDTAAVYPGQVLLEGTNLSEGQGTTRPFEIFGAPWLDAAAVGRRFESRRLRGVRLRRLAFEPVFHKWEGRTCHGFQIHVVDPASYRPYLTALALLQDIAAEHGDRFEWRQPPYEYVTDRLPIDLLTGDPAIRRAVEEGADLHELEESWRREIRAFIRESEPIRLYG